MIKIETPPLENEVVEYAVMVHAEENPGGEPWRGGVDGFRASALIPADADEADVASAYAELVRRGVIAEEDGNDQN